MGEEESGEGFDAGLAGEGPVELRAEVAEGGAAVERHDAGGAEERMVRAMSNSSSSSPTICSRTSSAVTMPTVEPNSSTTTAMWRRRSWNSCRSSTASLVSGTTGISRMTWRRVRPELPLPPSAEGDAAEVHEAGDVLGVDDADDVLGAVGGIVDGDAGVLLFDDAGAGVFDGHVGGEGEDFAAGGHDLADGDVVELDGAVDDLFLKGGQQAHAAGGGGDELELFGRVDGAFAA